MLEIAVLASGDGSNAGRIFEMAASGRLDVSVRLVVCNRPGANVVSRARSYGLPVLELDHRNFPDREAFDVRMIRAIRESGADTVVLAGYMRLLTRTFLTAFPDRVVNIHPALLPAFPGISGVAEAEAYGVKIYGCTVHFVSEVMDSGAIIIQAAMSVPSGETDALMLAQRIHTAEHRIYPQALQWLSEGRLRLEGRKVRLLPRPGVEQERMPDGILVSPPLEKGF